MPFPLYEKPLVELEIAVFDLETTGLYPSHDRIIQIAFVPIARASIEGAGRQWQVNPGEEFFPLDPVVVELTGLDPEELRDSPPIDEVLPEFAGLVDRRFVTSKQLLCTVAEVGGFVRTLIDPAVGREVEVVTDVDANAFAQFFLETIGVG